MDLFKKTNVIKATSFDYNAPKVVRLKNRNKISKMLNRYSRRKLKQKLKKEIFIIDSQKQRGESNNCK